MPLEKLRAALVLLLLLANTCAPLCDHAFAQSLNLQITGNRVSTAAALPATDIEARLAAIERRVEERRRAFGVPGLSLVIVKDDKIVYMKGFGVKDIERNLPVTPDTLFAIGSSTKAFTAMTIMMSADEEKLSLEGSPKKFLPYFKLRDAEADAQVTVRDLLCHRTGLDRTDLSLQFPEILTREDVIKIAGLAKPTAKLRERFQYQNAMYVAAGEAVAKANNTSWEKLVEARIFKPLGMTATNTSVKDMHGSADFSLGYDYNPETLETRNVKTVDETSAAPAGAINSTARDMAQWLRLMLGGGAFEGKRLISEKSFTELFTPQIQLAPKFGYGLGWFLRDWRGRNEVDHGGNIDGFNAMVAMIPDEHLGLAMLSNVTSSPLDNEIREIVYSNLLGQPEANTEAKTVAHAVDSPAKTRASPKEISPALKEILGAYESERTGIPIDIVANSAGGGALFNIKGQPPHALIETSKDSFAVEGLPEGFVLQIKRDASGKISGLAFNQREVVALLRRVTLPENAPSIEELMKKVIEAAGGEANIRKHSSMIMEAATSLEYEGMTGESIIRAKAPNLSASSMKYFALGKQLGESFDYFDGASAVSFATSNNAVIGTPFKKSGRALEDARIASDFYAPVDWQSLYQNVSLKRVSKIGGEDVYVVLKAPAHGHPVTDYISAKSFLVLRRESTQPTGYRDAVIPYVENFSDYKMVDGVMMPFKIVAGIPGSGSAVTIINSVKFNTDMPESMFRATSTTMSGNIKSTDAARSSMQQSITANPADVASIDAIIGALYDVISGDAGKKRDWNRLRSLFVPEGRMIPIAPVKTGGFASHALSVDGYIERSGNYVETNGFFEKETARRTEAFNQIAHVFSTYEGRHKANDAKPFLRGINSIQLMNDGKRWWIVNIMWDSERPDARLPEQYLKSDNRP